MTEKDFYRREIYEFISDFSIAGHKKDIHFQNVIFPFVIFRYCTDMLLV